MATLVTLGTSALAPELLEEKQRRLFHDLRSMGSVMIAYSGGTDSAYLAWAAQQALGADAVAITADSASIPESHKRDAEAFAAKYRIRHEYIPTFEFENPDYTANNPDRCFHCKDELFRCMEAYGASRGLHNIVYGVNMDDLGDYRPGQGAAKLHEVKAPLVDAGLSKAEIRELSRLAGLPTWDRPASACLSSRIPYGTPVTMQNVKTVEKGEEEIRALGFRQFRVRFHEKLVRIEIAPEELERALQYGMAARFVEIFKPLGFHYVTLDLEGYRQGAMNEVLA
ncbi:MAG: ATP-dependent sacrificial sulfur transferase LarE [Candidatus Solibacter usitatus]|nr:ATP-dependent sacrificial sulfur transferase LarE [Candidatus Solibacter usitatus]